MKLIEDIHKKLFKELELIHQRHADDCILIKFKIFGLLRPKACIDVFSRNDVKIVVYNGNKMIYETELDQNNRIDISERISIFQPNVSLKIYDKSGLILEYRLRNSLARKALKRLYEGTRAIYRRIRGSSNSLKTKKDNNYLDPFNVDEYNEWLAVNEKYEDVKPLEYNPKISIAIPVYNAPIKYLEECIDSVLMQTYENWELCLADDCSTDPKVKETLDKYAQKDNRIKVVYRKENGNISKATNSAFEVCTGDYISLLDNDDVITKDALYEVAKVINLDKDVDFIYSDEDKINTEGRRCDPHFKADFSPDTFLSNNYICHLTTFKKELLDEVGGEISQFDGAQDFDIFLRLTEKANKIYHIPKILYHWRVIPGSTSENISAKPRAINAGKMSVESALKRRNIAATVDSSNNDGTYIVNYEIANPRISIIINNNSNKIERCLKSIYEKTSYYNYEIIVVCDENNSTEIIDKFKKEHDNIKTISVNSNCGISSRFNEGVKASEGEYIVLLNNTAQIITSDWLKNMLMYASRNHIGAVGPKILNPDNTIQHGGMVLVGGNIVGYAYEKIPGEARVEFGRLEVPFNYDVVSTNCLMISKEKYQEIAGLDEDIKQNFTDVDFCIKLLEKGYYNVFVPTAELYCDKIKENINEDDAHYIIKKWGEKLNSRRFYNPNYSEKYIYKLDRSN